MDGQENPDVLRDYWHPVATSAEVKDQPFPVRLLNEQVVLWRSNGELVAFYDLCIHRGTPLSLGSITDGKLQCAYHGWQYKADGACALIPSLPPDRGIPAKARATTYRVVERYGLVWLCLGEPRADIPPFPAELDDPAFEWVTAEPEPLRANSARFIENNLDQSHFAFVHKSIFAFDPQVSPVDVVAHDDGFSYEVDNPLNTLDPMGVKEWSRFRVILPFTLFIEKFRPGATDRLILVFVGSPMSSKESRLFRLWGRNFRRMSDEKERELHQTVFLQDRAIVEAQRPEELPLDLREELHLRGPDAAALAYRKALVGLGVHWG